MTKILLIGASGYIGSQLTLELVRRNFDVASLDIKSNKVTIALGEFYRRDLSNQGPADILDVLDMCKPQYVIHMAGLVGYPACDKNPELADILNHQLLEYTAETDVPVLMLNAGDSIFGKQEDSIVNESTIPKPISVYGKTKYAGEQLAIDNRTVDILRLASVYGLSPQMRWDNLIHNFYLTAIKESALEIYQPDAIRNFVSITTVTNRIIQWINQWNDNHQDFGDEYQDPLIQHLVDLTITKRDIAFKIQTSIKLYRGQEINIYPREDYDPENRDYSFDSVYGRERLSWISLQDQADIIYQAGREVNA